MKSLGSTLSCLPKPDMTSFDASLIICAVKGFFLLLLLLLLGEGRRAVRRNEMRRSGKEGRKQRKKEI